MNRTKRWEIVVLALLVLVELWAFTGTFGKFFNHDSIFYVIYSPRSWGEFLTVLSTPDAARQYRPLSLAFTALLLPLIGLDPRPYHWLPPLFHVANTLLLWLLARRLLRNPVGALAAAGFWGLHSVAGWITYDITYLSDFMQAFFLLVSLILVMDGYERRAPARIAGSLVFYVAALLTKESAVTFPLAVFLCLSLVELRRIEGPFQLKQHIASLQKTLPLCLIYVLLSLALAGLLYHWLLEEKLYAQGPASAYDINPWANLPAKTKYIPWAFNIPDSLAIRFAAGSRALATFLVGGILVLWVLHIVTSKLRLAAIEWAAVLWFFGLNVPALLLSQRLAKWYLYVPLIGLAFAFGVLAQRLRNRLSMLSDHHAAPVVLGFLLIPWLFSTALQTRSFINSSDSSYASDVVENCLRDFQEQHPSLPAEPTVFVLPTSEKNVAEFFGNGKLYDLYYPSSRTRMLFADRREKLPPDYLSNPNVWILQYILGHVYDVTDFYKGRGQARGAVRVVSETGNFGVSMDPNEYYPPVPLQTPGAKPAFFPTPLKRILTQIAGSTVTVRMPPILRDSRLVFDVSWMHDMGDGGWAEARIRSARHEAVVFREYMQPNPKRTRFRWKSLSINLDPFAGEEADLILKCYNDEEKNTIADWLNWREIVLQYPNRPAGDD